MLGLHGTSVVVSTGDCGVALDVESHESACVSPGHTLSAPVLPPGSPYVTTIGATTLRGGTSLASLERAPLVAESSWATRAQAATFASGGGANKQFVARRYQTAAIGAYLRHSPPPLAFYDARTEAIGENAGVFNCTGHAYPDVSAVGDDIWTAVDGHLNRDAGGTSASALIFTVFVTHINGECMAVGKQPVGFLKPGLYANADAFHNVVEGSHLGCMTADFAAAKGWNLVAELGTPSHQELKDVFMSLP